MPELGTYTVTILLKAQEQISGAIKKATNAMKNMQGATTKLQKMFKRIQNTAIGVVTGMIAFEAIHRVTEGVKEAIDAFMEFEAESTKLAALSADVGQNIGELAQVYRVVASAASREYAVSANQALDALQALIKAGLSGEEATKALGAAIQMARLEMVDFQTAGNNLVQVLAQFGLNGSEATRVVDTLVNASRLGIGTANDFAQGLANCGASARNLGLNLEDTTTWLVVLERRFGSAQEAGTHLNRFFLELYEIAEKLGVPIRDANGALRDTNQVILDVIARAKELGGDFKNLQDRLTGVDMRALKALSTFTQMTESFQELREEIGRQGSTWEAYKRWLETTQGRFAAMSAEVDRMKRRIGESAGDIATYLGSVFLPVANAVFTSWKGIVAHAVGDVAGNLESAIETQMMLGKITEKQAGDWIKSWVDMGKITRQEAFRIAEHLGILKGGIKDIVNEAMKAGEEVPDQFQTLIDSSKDLEDQGKITAEVIVSLGKKFKLDADEAINLANKLLGLNLTWDEHDQLVKQLIQDYGFTEEQARRLVEAMAEEAEAKEKNVEATEEAKQAQEEYENVLKTTTETLQSSLTAIVNYGAVYDPLTTNINKATDALAKLRDLGIQIPNSLQKALDKVKELDDRLRDFKSRTEGLGGVGEVAGIGEAFIELRKSFREEEVAPKIRKLQDEIDELTERLEEVRNNTKMNKSIRETQIEQLEKEIERRRQQIDELKKSVEYSAEEAETLQNLGIIQKVVSFQTQVMSLYQTGLKLAMMGATDAGRGMMNAALDLSKALEDGIVTDEEKKKILEELGVKFDETGKPVLSLKDIMKLFQDQVKGEHQHNK